jgi:hypothetical protein
MALLVIAVVSSLVLYEVVWIMYQLWFSPLASIPGPFLARISNLWLTYYYALPSPLETDIQ